VKDSDDAVWQEIVDNYGERVLDDPEPRADEPAAGSGQPVVDPALFEPLEPEPEDEPAELQGTGEPEGGWFRPFADEDDGFVPPDPEPVRLAPDRAVAWAGVLGVPVLTLLGVMLTRLTDVYVPGWLGVLAVIAFLGGFGYLVATMPREPDDPWDDGARL